MESAYFERGLRRALDHAQRLAVDERDLREVFENKKHVRKAQKILRDLGLHEFVRDLEQTEYRPTKFATPAEEFGYFVGIQSIINGEKGIDNTVKVLEQMRHLPRELVAEILSKIIIPHAIPPIGAIKSPYAYSPQRKILTRMKIRAVGNSLPELTAKLLKEAKIDHESMDEQNILRKISALERGMKAVGNALDSMENPERATQKLQEHINKLDEEGLPIHSYYDIAIKELKKGNVDAATTYLQILRSAQMKSKDALMNELKRAREKNISKNNVWETINRSDARLILIGLAQDIDLGNKTAIEHWEKIRPETIRMIEDVFKERVAKIKHLENIHNILRYHKYRAILEKAVAWSRKMGGEDRKAIKELIWGMAERDPEILRILEQYNGKTNGIAEPLWKVAKISEQKV